MYAGNETNKDTLHVSPHIAAHRSSSPGSLSAHIPTYRMGAEDILLYRTGGQSVLNLKSNDVQSSQGVACSSSNSISHLLKNGPQDLTAHSTSQISEKSSTSVGALPLTSSSIHYQKSSPHIHTVVSQGMPTTQLIPAHITERTSYYRVPDSVIGIQAPSAILVSSNVDSHLTNTQSSQSSNVGHNGTSQNLGITSTTGVLSAPLPAHLSSSSFSSNGSSPQISPGTIFKLEKNPQHIENLTSMAPHTPPPQQEHHQIQHQHQSIHQSQSYQQESRQHPRQQDQEQHRQQHSQQSYEQQTNQQQQNQQQNSVQHQQHSQQQLSSSMPIQRNDLVQQALRAVSSNPNQTGNDKEVLEYNYTAGDIAELLMMNIQGNALLQASKKQPGTTTSIGTLTTGVTTGPLSDNNNESQVVLLQPAAIDETNCLQPQLPLISKQKLKPPVEDQQDKRVKIAQRMRNKRADENDEAKSIRRLREAERMRRKRAGEDEDTKVKRRQEAAVRARLRRATMSDDERVVDRKRAAERMRLRRKTEDDHQKAIRRMKAAERMRKRRALETPEQRATRRANISEKMKARRKVKPDETNNEDSSTESLTKPTFPQSDSEARGETLVELPEVTIERSSLQRAQLERTQQILRAQDIERPQIQQRVIHSHNENQTFSTDLKIDLQQHKFDVQSKYKIEGVKIENVNDSRIIVPTNLAQSSGLTLVHINDFPISSTISASSTPTTLSTVDLSQLSGQSSSMNTKSFISSKEVVQLSESQLQSNNKVLPSNQELQQQLPLSLSTKSSSIQGLPQDSGLTFSAISGNVKSFSINQELSHLSGHQMPVNTKALSQETTQILSQSVSSNSKNMEHLSPISRQSVNIKPQSANQPLSQIEQPVSLNSKPLSSVQDITQICGQTLAGNFKSFSSNSELLQFGQPLILNAKSLSSIQGIAQVSGQPFIITKSLSSHLDPVQTEQPVLINAKSLLSNQSLGQPVTFIAKNPSNNQESTNSVQQLSRNIKSLPYSYISGKPIISSKIVSSNEELSHSSQPLPLTARISSKYDTSHGQPTSFGSKKITPSGSVTRQEITEPLSLQKYQQVRQTGTKSLSPPLSADVLASDGTYIATMIQKYQQVRQTETKSSSPTLSANVVTSDGSYVATTAPSTSGQLNLSYAKPHHSTLATSIATTASSTSAPLELSYAKQHHSTLANHHHPSTSTNQNHSTSTNHSHSTSTNHSHSTSTNHNHSTSANLSPQQQSLPHVNFQQQHSSSLLHVQQRHHQT